MRKFERKIRLELRREQRTLVRLFLEKSLDTFNGRDTLDNVLASILQGLLQRLARPWTNTGQTTRLTLNYHEAAALQKHLENVSIHVRDGHGLATVTRIIETIDKQLQ